MIKIYSSGDDFYNDNKDFLLQNKHVEVFFRYDSPLLKETNKDEYALKAYDDSQTLLVLLKEPFNILFYGDPSLSDEIVDFLHVNCYKIKDYLCVTDLGDALIKSFKKLGYDLHLQIGMDFMEAKEKCNVSTLEVENATLNDVDEICEMMIMFFKDCGLNDKVNKEHLRSVITKFKIIRKDGVIVSTASYSDDSEDSKRVTHVFTRREYRGKGYAKKVVGAILNEIIDLGYIATLNVDQKNPISYHLYTSLGFKKIFSQGIYIFDK